VYINYSPIKHEFIHSHRQGQSCRNQSKLVSFHHVVLNTSGCVDGGDAAIEKMSNQSIRNTKTQACIEAEFFTIRRHV